jgi:hypothetical protein
MVDHKIMIFAVFAIILISVVIWLIAKSSEGFADEPLFKTIQNTTTTTTTLPSLVRGGSGNPLLTNQRANVIYYGTGTISPVSDSSEYGTKDMTKVISVSLGQDSEPFVIKQILISGITLVTPTSLNKKIRVSSVDTKNNQVHFAGLNYNLTNNGNQAESNTGLEASEIMNNRITQLYLPANGVFLDDIRTMFGTDLVGNKINIFTDADVASIGSIVITGYKETQKWNPDMLSGLTETTPAAAVPTVFPTGKQVVVRAIKFQSGGTEGAKFRLTYTSPYSNNVFTYPGPVDGQFIYTSKAPTIYLSRMLLTSTAPIIVSVMQGTTIPNVSSYMYLGDISQGDITKFRMENNLTDLRGSINPDYVCPDMQGLVNKHLDAETIVDSMEYLDKINTEKVKLSSNKNNLLTLMEQEEDIKKLEGMVKKIRELQTRRTQETDALAALQFTKQLNEVMRLREALEQRIAKRNRNTLNIEVGITDADAAAAQGTPDARDVYKIS